MRLRFLAVTCLAFLPLLSPLPSHAASRTCLVVGISDGDTLTARCGRFGSYDEVKVRIAAIDAPERAQPYGQRSRQALSRLCYFEQAVITEHDTDRYGRTVADVTCDGQDAGTQMVAEGWAWVYDFNGIATRRGGGLFKLQESARAQRLGLSAGAKPTAPWEWRRRERENRANDSLF